MKRRDYMTEEERKIFKELCRKLAAQMNYINGHKEKQVVEAVA